MVQSTGSSYVKLQLQKLVNKKFELAEKKPLGQVPGFTFPDFKINTETWNGWNICNSNKDTENWETNWNKHILRKK